MYNAYTRSNAISEHAILRGVFLRDDAATLPPEPAVADDALAAGVFAPAAVFERPHSEWLQKMRGRGG